MWSVLLCKGAVWTFVSSVGVIEKEWRVCVGMCGWLFVRVLLLF
jgi:hypothetical protein